jgi:peptidoglycan/LPS O-acetylase OafA/YrhL
MSKSFSALSNSELILSLKHGSNDIKCIHGLRAASAFWIIFGHVLAVAYKDVPAINSYVLVEWVKNLPSMFIVSAIFGVDTFFVLTSLLLTLSFFRQLENK